MPGNGPKVWNLQSIFVASALSMGRHLMSSFLISFFSDISMFAPKPTGAEFGGPPGIVAGIIAGLCFLLLALILSIIAICISHRRRKKKRLVFFSEYMIIGVVNKLFFFHKHYYRRKEIE